MYVSIHFLDKGDYTDSRLITKQTTILNPKQIQEGILLSFPKICLCDYITSSNI